MAEPASPKYAVNPQTGQVMRNDGTGWTKVKTAKNQQGDILINEGGAWTPLPRKTDPAAPPPGYSAPPKMSIAKAAEVTGAQGKEFGFADEASAVKRSLGLPKQADALLEANPFNRFLNIGLGAGTAIADAAGVKMSPSYTQAKDAENAQLAQAREDRPATSFISEVAQSAAYPGGTLRMGAPLLRESAKMLGIGAVQGGFYGFGAGEGEGRVQDAGTGALIGGAIGAATPGAAAAALPLVRGTGSAIASLTDNIVELFGGTGTASESYARQVAEAAIRRSVERSGMTPERILEQLQRYGNKEAVLAEVIGQDAINTLSSLTRRPGATPQRAQDIIAERMGGFQERAADDLRQTTGLTDAQIRGDFGPELQARREAAAPVYDELFQQQGNVASERLAALSGTNTLGPMIRRAQSAASDLAIAQRRNPASVTPLEVLDLAKRELDDEIATATRNQQNAEVMRLQSLQTALLQELDGLTGGQYAAARQAGGEAPRLQEARTQGERALLPGTTRATVAEQAAALNPQDRNAFASGAVARMDEQIANNQLDPRRFRNPAMQEKLGAALGPEAGQDLSQRMVAEAELRDLAGRWGPRSGSITGTVLENGPSEALDDGIRFATALARGDRIGFVTQAVSWMRRRGYNQQQIDAMGEILLSNPQEGLRRLGIQLPTPGAPGAAGAAMAAPPPQGAPPAGGPPPASTPPQNAFAQPTQGGPIRANGMAAERGTIPEGAVNVINNKAKPSLLTTRAKDTLENAFGAAYMSGTGSVAGTQYDLNGDGVIDGKDVAVGSLAGLGVMAAPTVARNIKGTTNAFAAKVKGQGIGKARTPQQAARFETPGSPEYEAAKAKGLDMSQAGRMARAKDMGFDTEKVFYHGTDADISAFRTSNGGTFGEGVYLTGDPKLASGYATQDGGNVLPVYVKGKIATEADIDPNIPAYGGGSDKAYDAYAKGFSGYLHKYSNGTEELIVFNPRNIRSVNAAFDPDKAASPILTAGMSGGPRKPRAPKADSPEAITEAVKGIAKAKKPEPTRLERMVEEGKDAAVPPINTMPSESLAAGEKALRMLERGKTPLDIYDETAVVILPYNGANIPVVSQKMGPEELIRTFYSWLAEPPAKRPGWVTRILEDAPKKKGLMLTKDNERGVPANAFAKPAEQPLPKAGFPAGAVAIGTGAGLVTGIPAGVMAGTMIAREQDSRRKQQTQNAFASR
jgi:hypothetical protein